MSKIKTASTHPYEIEELACAITGLDYEEIDADTEFIEGKLMNDLGVDLQQFQEIVEKLLPLIDVGGGVSDIRYKGFAVPGSQVWLVKNRV